MFRPLSTISLPASAHRLLNENGFSYCEDVLSHRGVVPEARNLLHKWNIHSNECWNALITAPATLNSLDLWQKECTNPGIVSWSKEIDTMLDGGVPLQSITELCGAPGAGKTQISLQLAVAVQIPEFLGGLGGEAVFIDTASNFSPQRARDMSNACSKHCQRLCDSHDKNYQQLSTDNILQGIHVVLVNGIPQLFAAIKLLPKLLEQHTQVRLVVVDSLAFPFNSGETCSTIDRTSYVYRIMSDLQRLAIEKNLAVVVTNQLTTRIIKSVSTRSELSPALGESMGHRVNRRLLLGHVPGGSNAMILLKGNNQRSSNAKFRITKAGIRDL